MEFILIYFIIYIFIINIHRYLKQEKCHFYLETRFFNS